MNSKQDFVDAGFYVIGEENSENKLLKFLKENYPSVIKDNEINIQELKAILGLPVDEKVNGYGLNFVGRNVARAKYAQKTDKELKLNKELSKNIDTTQNLVLKGDNLDCLKILKNYYSGKIKCIYIDPPYNTDSDEFVYPDKFDKEEAEVLGLQNLSDDDFARMEFAFTTKKSHNGWLAFMYPRLLLARDLLSDDGVIFISIDDNEQANLKLLCDEIFGEENFIGQLVWENKEGGGSSDSKHFRIKHEYLLVYGKSKDHFEVFGVDVEDIDRYKFSDEYEKERGKYQLIKLDSASLGYIESLDYPIEATDGTYIYPNKNNQKISRWRWSKEKLKWGMENGFVVIKKDTNNEWAVYTKQYLNCDADGNIKKRTIKPLGVISKYSTTQSNKEIIKMFNQPVFNYSKPVEYIKFILKVSTINNDIILDFFAGSGTTGHAVMQLNAEDGGNRKFILVQIDEPIKEDKPAYKFCIENSLPPVISSITIERLKRAGEKIKQEIEKQNNTKDLFITEKKQLPDIGFKVFKIE